MKNYTPSSATYRDTISIVESNDTVSVNNANAAVKQLIENDIVIKAAITELEKLSIPVAYGSLAYNGKAQTQYFINYDSSKMTVSNNVKTNVGTYTAVFTLNSNNYMWSDNTTAPKEVS